MKIEKRPLPATSKTRGQAREAAAFIKEVAMRKIAALLLLAPAWILALSLAVPAHADEILLKGGKTLEWVSIKDNGDTYEVTGPNGVKTVVKKDDISAVVVGPSVVPLTGAMFEFKGDRKAEVIDLFKGLDVQKAPACGSWSTVNGALVGSHQGLALGYIEFQAYAPPDEYDLCFTAERVSGVNHFSATLPGGGRQFTVYFDATDQTVMETVDGKDWKTSPVRADGNSFPIGKAVSVTLMVRRAGLVVRLDGKDHMTWKGDWNVVSGKPRMPLKASDTIALGLFRSSFKVTRAVVIVPKVEAKK